MSKIRDLPETTSLDGNDLLYAVDASEGPNGGRKITKDNLKASVAQTPSEIKTAYESNADTNAFTDAEKTKLANIDPDSAEDFKPSIVTGRILGYTQGTVRYDGVFYELAASQILLSANITDGYVYVDLDGIIKQTASSVLPPPYTVVIARFSTDLNNIVGLQDQRAKTEQNLIRGSSGDITSVGAGVAVAAGSSGKIADAAHVHNILTAAPSTQNADQSNAEGSSSSLARADHTHNIPTATPSTSSTSSSNTQGSANTFAKSDHVHEIQIATQNATATTDDTTTSTTDVLMVGMTQTPAAGSYLVIWSGSMVNSGNGAERNFVSIYVGGTRVTATERPVGVAGGAYTVASTQAVVTVNGSQAIEIRWRVVAGTGTVRQRRLSLLRVD